MSYYMTCTLVITDAKGPNGDGASVITRVYHMYPYIYGTRPLWVKTIRHLRYPTFLCIKSCRQVHAPVMVFF